LAIFEKSLGCGHCHLHDACPMVNADINDPCHVGSDHEGLGFLASAVLVFVLPLLTGIGGAFAAGAWLAKASEVSLHYWQAVGMAGGLVFGVILAQRLQAWRRRDGVEMGGAQ